MYIKKIWKIIFELKLKFLVTITIYLKKNKRDMNLYNKNKLHLI